MYVLNHHNTIANQFLAELRDTRQQQDRMKFRANLELLGSLLAFELSKTLTYYEKEITTPLGIAKVNLPKNEMVCATILRAGMPLLQGVLKIFNTSEAAFVGAARGAHQADNSFEIELGYVACPSLDGKCLVVADPMLASGKSLVEACKALFKNGKPKELHLLCVIGSPEGVAYIKHHLPEAKLWIAAIDEKLDEHSYIVPGLGDAGDLSFGEKI